MIRVIFHLLFPLIVLLLYLYFSSAATDEIQINYPVLKAIFFMYILFSIPHFIVLLHALTCKVDKRLTNILFFTANIVLVSFGIFIQYLVHAHYMKVGVIWFIYPVVAILAIYIAWTIVHSKLQNASNEV